MLVGVTWAAFASTADDYYNEKRRFHSASRHKVGKVMFYAKYGLHMQRPVIAIVAQGWFVSFTQVHPCPIRNDPLPIIANSIFRNKQQYLFVSDFAPDRHALTAFKLTTFKGVVLSRHDPVLEQTDEN